MKEDLDIRNIIYTNEFEEFYNSVSQKVRDKIDYVLYIVHTQYVVNEKFVKKLENTIFYEIRISVGFNEYRTIIFSVNSENLIQSTEILLLNSFLKKDTKDYKKAIQKAQTILNNLEYGTNDKTP